VVSAALVFTAICEAEEPAELAALRVVYFQSLAKVERPVTSAYIKALGLVQATLIDSGKVEEALQVLKARTKLKESMESGDTSRESVTIAEDTAEAGQESANHAKDSNEYSLGGTTWSWLVRNGEIRFENDGSAKIRLKGEKDFVESHFWKRKAPREFLISNGVGRAVTYRFEVSSDGKHGTCIETQSNAIAEMSIISP